MKIAIDCRLLDKKKNTGISRYTEFLLEYYKSRYRKSELIIIVNDRINDVDITQSITPLRPFRISDFYRFRAYVRTLDVSFLHSPFYSSIHKPIHGVINVTTVHDLMYRILPDFFSGNVFVNQLGVIYYNNIVGKSIESSDKVIAVSSTTSGSIKKYYMADSVIIPENSCIASAPDRAILIRHNLTKGSYFFYCGNPRRHKNLEFIKHVFSTSSNLPTLVLAGPGHVSAGNVLSVGVVNDNELRALYEDSIAFVFPSKYEGFGLPILEALHAGTQVVASNISAFLEFNSPSIHYFDIDSVSSFVAALDSARHHPMPTPLSFYESYSDELIYQKIDSFLAQFTDFPMRIV